MLEGDTHLPFEALTKIWDERYESRRAWWKGPYDLSLIMQRLASGATVLDAGCGSGRYLVPLVRNGFKAVGADLSRQALTQLDPRYVRVVADVRRLPFSDRCFDAVACYGVLQHLTLAGRAKAVDELFRVLKHRGLALVEVTGQRDMRNHTGTRIGAHSIVRGGIPYHYFSPSELRELFLSVGFVLLSLDELITKKQFGGAVYTRHRILTAMTKS